MIKNPPAIWETWVQSLGWKDPLEEEWQPTLIFLPGDSPWTEEPVGLQSRDRGACLATVQGVTKSLT